MTSTPEMLIEDYQLPVLPLRDIVVFPGMIVPLFVGRQKSVAALEAAVGEERRVLMVTQKDPKTDEPTQDDLHSVGVLGNVLQLLKLPDGTVKVLVEGHERASLVRLIDGDDVLTGEIEVLETTMIPEDDEEGQALAQTALERFEDYVRRHRKIPNDVISAVQQLDDIERFADTLAAHLAIKLDEKQELLEITDTRSRLNKIMTMVEVQIGVMETEHRIRSRVKSQMDKNQREYYLNEQIKAIQKELNEDEDGGEELRELEEKIKALNLPEDAAVKAKRELKKLKMMNPMAAEAGVLRNYLEWITELPWGQATNVKRSLKQAQKILDEDHYGLKKVKERILEYIAVQQRTKKNRGPILCLVGAPGVGKTSLGKSIARATGRNFVRIALGGVHDESEIRGHRRTYIGALPGKIIQGMKRAKSANPVFLLDEIDKLGADFRGDPSSALLEVLDPEQNDSFNDHYLGMDYDLSDVMFICTANSTNIPRPLMDRMEIIHISGYTEDEKKAISQRHLIEKQRDMNGLKPREFDIAESALSNLIRHYTREAGVRGLERAIAGLARKAVKEIMMKKRKALKITNRNLKTFAGVPKYRYGQAEVYDLPGITTGLAWMETGGDILMIEAVTVPGKDGKVTMTGKLGDVMKESVTAAEMLIKSRCHDFGITPESLANRGIHIHVPEGATPKDGPSAGIAMVTSIVSTLTGIPVRKTVAMTGEITLRGKVFPIGGLKEKLLAAHRGGIKTVIIPAENEKDLEEIPQRIKGALEIVPVETIDQVLKTALVVGLQPIDVDTENNEAYFSLKTAQNQEKPAIHH